jgi:hypothetical protein
LTHASCKPDIVPEEHHRYGYTRRLCISIFSLFWFLPACNKKSNRLNIY